jgi:hypothetical protein
LYLLVSLATRKDTRKRLVVLGTHGANFGCRVLGRFACGKLEPDAADDGDRLKPPSEGR